MSIRNDELPSVLNRGRSFREVEPGREGTMQEGRRAKSRSSSRDSDGPRRPRRLSLDPVSDEEDIEPIPASQAATSGSNATTVFPARGFGSFAASSGFSGRFGSSFARSTTGSFSQGASAFGGLARAQTLPVNSVKKPIPREAVDSGDIISPAPGLQSNRGTPSASANPTRSPSPVLQNVMTGNSFNSQVTTVSCSSRHRSATPAPVAQSPLSSSTEQISSAFTYQQRHTQPSPAQNAVVNTKTKTSNSTQPQPISLHNFFQAPVQYPIGSRSKPAQTGSTSTSAPSSTARSKVPEQHSTSIPQDRRVLQRDDPPLQKPPNLQKTRKRGDWKVPGYVNNTANEPPPIAILKRQPAFTAMNVNSAALQTYHYTENTPRKVSEHTERERLVQHPQTGSRTGSQVHSDSNPSADFSMLEEAEDYSSSAYAPQEDYGRAHSYPSPRPEPESSLQVVAPSHSLHGTSAMPSIPAAALSGANANELQTVEINIEDERTGESLFIEDDFILEPGPRGIQRLDIRKLADVLQSGPSRRDGPAKVYTLRNGRKQYVVEVSEENVDKFGSGKVQIPEDLILTLHVEYPQASIKQLAPSQPVPPSQALVTPFPLTTSIPQLASPAISENASPAMTHIPLSSTKRTRPDEDALIDDNPQKRLRDI